MGMGHFKDYTLVLVPYCSGDLFLGSTYGNDGLNHHGAEHAITVIEWASRKSVFYDAENVLVSGNSAGGVAAAATAPLHRDNFSPSTNVFYFADSGIYPDIDMELLEDAWGFQTNPLTKDARC